MAEVVRTELHDDVAVIVVDNPPVNALSQAVRQGLQDHVAAALDNSGVKAIAIVGAGRTFIAGADIREFGKPPQAPDLNSVINAIEAADKPVIAALHGTALGGGYEVALGCHYRVAVPSARVGLPEVTLGILPGAGGTQRLPRLAGAAQALAVALSGRPVKAADALKHGMIDEIADGEDPISAGVAMARKVLNAGGPVRRTGDIPPEAVRDADPQIFADARAGLEKTARGLFSPFKIVDAVEAASQLPIADGLKRERALFTECMNSPQREGLIHAFFAERAVTKVPEASAGTPRPLKSAAVIGGGTMGTGITIALLSGGLPVTMLEMSDEAAEKARARVDSTLQGGVDRGKISAEQKTAIMGGLYKVVTDMAALKDADLVIEAVFEEMSVKKDVFGKLDKIAKPGAILASNTSYLDVNEIAAATSRPQDVLGLHFFSPANIMKLVEIVVAEKASPDVVATSFALAKKIGKVPVRAGVCDGFIGNRILSVYRQATDEMVLAGASPFDVDKAVVNFGYPMGPHAMGDLAGLDIGWAVRKRKIAESGKGPNYAEFHDRICEKGWYGQKTGKGFYDYSGGNRRGVPNPEVLPMIEAERAEKGIAPRAFSEEEIIERYLAAMINEGAKVVEEGIALRPLDVDVTKLYGYAFPRHRGGPMKYADMIGLDTVLASIKTFEKTNPTLWKPAALLEKLVAEGQNFDSLNQATA